MIDGLDASRDDLPLAVLMEATEWTEADGKWAKFHTVQEEAFKALEARRKELESIYERAIAPDSEWQDVIKVAEMVGEWGRIAAEKLRPQIDILQQKLAAPDHRVFKEIRQALSDSIEIAETWLTLYCDLREKLLKLAAKRRPADAVLRARPVEGEIDYDELSREHIARYPQVRAALAK